MSNWIDRILSSNAGQSNPEAARKLIEKAGGSVPAAKDSFPVPSSPTAPPPATESSND